MENIYSIYILYHYLGTRDYVSYNLITAHVKISQFVNKMCSQQACGKLVNKL
jgi:hypothetical protein